MKMTTLRKRFRNPMAFTLIELILVITLMAILAGLVTPALRNSIKKTSDSELKAYAQEVEKQISYVIKTYNTETPKGETPRLAGYNLTTARGMQECLRSANNFSGIYDIELTTIGDAPDPNLYNYIDTIVISVQFFTAENDITPIVNAKGLPCSPEQAVGGAKAYTCKLINLWYIKKGAGSILYATNG